MRYVKRRRKNRCAVGKSTTLLLGTASEEYIIFVS